MPGYKFVRKDVNKFGGGIAFYITDQLPSWFQKIENLSNNYEKLILMRDINMTTGNPI